MKSLEKIIKRVILSSLAGISINQSSSAVSNPEPVQSFEIERLNGSFIFQKNSDSPKLILKRSKPNSWDLISHRSHRSHSSHRSHYSSSTGGSSNSGLKPGPKAEQNSSTEIQLGSRNLQKGMSGTDVTELVNILLKKGYLKLEDGKTQVNGVLNFDEIVEGALKKFQSDNGLTSNGICDSSTIYYLKNK